MSWTLVTLLVLAAPPDLSEAQLRPRLWHASHEVDLGGGRVVLDLYRASKEFADDGDDDFATFVGPVRSPSQPLRELVAGRDDLRGLPFLSHPAAKLSQEESEALEKVSLAHRRLDPMYAGRKLDPAESAKAFRERLEERPSRLLQREAIVRPLEQVLQSHAPPMREELVRQLGAISAAEARRALARRAVFDLSPELRLFATGKLGPTDRAVVRPVFLQALRHPWPSAANHAAWALVRLDDRDALPALRELEKLPDPGEPWRDRDDVWHKRIVARIDHLRNCLLCHPAAADIFPGWKLREPLRVPGMLFEPDPKDDSRYVGVTTVLLRPDFSARFDRPGDAALGWPRERRFDFVAFVRRLSDAERREHLVRRADPPTTYPQREAVRWAIKELTRK